MKEEMGVLTAHEVNKLMRKLSRERARVIREFVTRAYALEIGEEFFQCHLSALPELEELKRLLETSTMTFCIWQTINGTIVKREA
jgi:hypothetical protein